MKRVSPHLKMRVLGAIEFAPGNTTIARIHHVSSMPFIDEGGVRLQFTWRTIKTWYSRYKKDGITAMQPRTRSDKGLTRKVTPEEISEAINQVMPFFHAKSINVAAIYRTCIEEGLLRREQVARTTFIRVVKKYDLLKPEDENSHKRRRAFAKAHANQMWQAYTMFGPYVQNGTAKCWRPT